MTEERVEYFKDGTIKSQSTKYRLTPNKMPTLFGFAQSIGVTVQTLHTWCDYHPEFSDAFDKAKQLQKEWLISVGLSGAAPPQFAIFTAKNVTDMRDKIENFNVNQNVFFVPPAIAEKHGLTLPEAEPRPLPSGDVKVIEPSS